MSRNLKLRLYEKKALTKEFSLSRELLAVSQGNRYGGKNDELATRNKAG
jgi:hypothetical protein